jgi:3-hydroxy-9,10-secoandrosta-1,3,5(10)-triene-9,17-dione monooxygenase reductase component
MTRSTDQLAIAPLVPEVAAGLFRETLGRFATGVALVTAGAEGVPLGLIANSLASVSLSPPLVSFCPSRDSFTWSRMRRARRFGVNLLGAQHEDYVRRAAPADADRFAGIDWELTPSGVPRLGDALAFLECAIDAEHPAGDPLDRGRPSRARAVRPRRRAARLLGEPLRALQRRPPDGCP